MQDAKNGRVNSFLGHFLRSRRQTDQKKSKKMNAMPDEFFYLNLGGDSELLMIGRPGWLS